MKTFTVTKARKHLYQLIQQVELEHEPVFIKNKDKGAVMIAESDWNAICETLHLLSIPGMKQSIVTGLNTPLTDCKTQLKS